MMPEVVGGNSETRVFRKASCYIKKKKKKGGEGPFQQSIPNTITIWDTQKSECIWIILHVCDAGDAVMDERVDVTSVMLTPE